MMEVDDFTIIARGRALTYCGDVRRDMQPDGEGLVSSVVICECLEVHMATNVKVLGWLYIVLGILGVLTGLGILAILFGTGVLVNDREAAAILIIVGTVVAVIVTLVSAPGIVVGAGLINFKAWARVMALILGFLNLPGFPLGTVLGIYTFVSLLNSEAEAAFARS